ncbi:MAG: terminase large subunit [Alphaproteobacteria bacterium]
MNFTTACPDWERRIVARESMIPFAPQFPDQAAEGLRVFGSLRAVDVAGSPTFGEITRQWALDIVAAIFGSYDAETGRRLIREVFLLISKKNGKSTDLAGIILTALLLNWRESAEMGILAPTIEVANNAWGPARDAIRADEELSDLLHMQDHIRKITHRTTGATLQVVAADSETVAGKKWSVTLIDEVWLFGKRPNARAMFAEATGGMASRPEGFVMYSSTQSDEAPAGVFKEKLDYARGVRDGRIHDPAFLPILYEHPKSMLDSGDYREPKNFYVTNPNLGASVDEEDLVREHKKAEAAGEAAVIEFFAKRLNVQIGQVLRSDGWAGAEFWAQAANIVSLDTLLERCEVITGGIDGGGLDDLLGACAVGRERDTGRWLAWCRAWCHPIALKRRQINASKYRDFEKDGDLVIVEKVGQDVEQLVDIFQRLHKAGLLHAIGVDPAGIGDILDALDDAGIPKDKLIGISQGWKLTGAIKTTERRLADRSLVHDGSPLMAWCVSNAKVEPKGNAIVITKQASGSGKIDPLMALLNAVSLMALNPAPAPKYDVFFV